MQSYSAFYMRLRHMLDHSDVKDSWSHTEDEHVKKRKPCGSSLCPFLDRVSSAQDGLELEM